MTCTPASNSLLSRRNVLTAIAAGLAVNRPDR
jgi:hypothetical protein